MLIILSGEARSGKDTFGKILSELLKKEGEHFNTIAFADALKKLVMSEFNLTYEQVYGNLKELEDKRYPKMSVKGHCTGFWTPREILQFIGTDVYRKIDKSYWIKKLYKQIELVPANYIITDGRFINEIDSALDRDGIHFRVERKNKDFTNNRNHSSEKELRDYTINRIFSYIVKNDYNNEKDLEVYMSKMVVPIILEKLGEENG